ncbi:MAG: hypothetical protein R3B90_09050 [Planctomycetaceae bacterium]
MLRGTANRLVRGAAQLVFASAVFTGNGVSAQSSLWDRPDLPPRAGIVATQPHLPGWAATRSVDQDGTPSAAHLLREATVYHRPSTARAIAGSVSGS